MTTGLATQWYLGVDAGGTHSRSVVVDGQGRVRGRGDGGPANYQVIGSQAARRAIGDTVDRALHASDVRAESLTWAGYGIAGADRPKDFAAIDEQLPALPGADRRTLVNDSELVLHAGTPDGIGIGVVAGTGTNALGRGPGGAVSRVGGLCYELGDFGAAGDLGREALRAAMRGRDGRGAPTLMYDLLCSALGVDPLEDIIDLWMSGDPRGADMGRWAPLVFEAASANDAVAHDLLVRAGEEIALSVKVLIDRLFSTHEGGVTVVLGGSVLQRGAHPAMVQSLAREVKAHRGSARVVRLEAEPVLGGVLLAQTQSERDVGARRAFRERLGATLSGGWVREIEVG